MVTCLLGVHEDLSLVLVPIGKECKMDLSQRLLVMLTGLAESKRKENR